jgi:hypothetical protein
MAAFANELAGLESALHDRDPMTAALSSRGGYIVGGLDPVNGEPLDAAEPASRYRRIRVERRLKPCHLGAVTTRGG